MAVGWIASFKTIPWTKVLSVAPSIVDGAKKLWSSVTRKDAQIPKPPNPLEEKISSHDEVLSAINARVHSLELRTTQLGEEAVSSSEIIKSLAEQQSQLVHAVDILRVRTRALLWVCGLLGLAIIVLLFSVTGR